MSEARSHYGITALRKATSLINAPSRTATGDAAPALDLLMKAQGPKEVLSGEHAETSQLLAAKDEIRQSVDQARKVAPTFSGEVALVFFSSPCQVHPLIAQQWRGRRRSGVVIAAHVGYRRGRVHFAARSSRGTDILGFLASVRPPGTDDQYGNGHRAASGGALRSADWNWFVRTLGFDATVEVPETLLPEVA